MFIAPITAEVRTTCPYCGVGCGVLASHGVTGQSHAATLPWRGRVGSPSGDPGWGDGDAACAEALSPPPGPLKRADLPPPGGGGAIALPGAEVKGDPAHPANAGRLCSKGSALGETLGTERRLLVPEISGRRASWDEALDLAAAKFSGTIEQHGPESVAMYVSGQFLTEDYYVANKLMKGFFGAANIDTNSRLCMASSVAGHIRAFGEDVVPGCYADIDEADLAVLVGSNAAWCHPVLHQRLQAARAAHGTKVITIDVRGTATSESADLALTIRPGTDAVVFCSLLVEIAD